MPSERTFKAPVAEYNNRLVFNRFKWAEEATHTLDRERRAWVMFRDMDKIEIETYDDGTTEEYVHEQYVVLWNE
jgi:uncharacterized protein YecT (DUF1311 family)